MTRILALSAFYPPHHFGGYELSCRDVVVRWRRNGHDVHVLTGDVLLPGVASDAEGADDPQVTRALRLYWREHQSWSPPLLTRLRIERRNQRLLHQVLDEFKPDVVSFWHMAGMSMGLLAGVVDRGLPLVGVLGDNWLVFGPKKDAWIRLFVDRPRAANIVGRLTGLPTRLADIGAHGAFCFVSDWTRTQTQANTRWTLPVTTVVHNGVDPETFAPVGPDSQIARPWQWRLLYAGRLDRVKGVDTLIRAFALLPQDARLTISGRGGDDYQSELLTLARELKVHDRITWVEVPRNELRGLYAASDVLVFPSRWAEPFGLVPVEAMACGTPVVTTGTGGAGEFCVDEVNCLRFPRDDVEALAAAVHRLADDEQLRRRIVAGGLATATELTVDRYADALESWHEWAAHGFNDEIPPDHRLPLAAS